MRVTPLRLVELDHRAFHLASDGLMIAVTSRERDVTVVDPQGGLRKLGGDWGEIHSVSVHPSQDCVAVCHRDLLTISDLEGAPLFEDQAPWGGGEEDSWLQRGFGGCCFTPDGSLWCAAPLSTDEIEIQLRSALDWSVAQRLTVEDPYGGSSCSFHPTSYDDSIALWAAAGQDGQSVIWISRGDPLFDEEEPELVDTAPPVFSPLGGEFIAEVDHGSICRFSYPDVRKLGNWTLPGCEPEPCYSMGYLGGGHALVGSDSGRIFVIHLGTMETAGEVYIVDTRISTPEEVDPTLTRYPPPFSDMTFFMIFGDSVIVAFRQEKPGWKDSLGIFSTSQFLPSDSDQSGQLLGRG